MLYICLCVQQIIVAVLKPHPLPPAVAGRLFPTCRQIRGFGQMRMMMWHLCQWRWSQVRLLSVRTDGVENNEQE